jgi:hypothetical protein
LEAIVAKQPDLFSYDERGNPSKYMKEYEARESQLENKPSQIKNAPISIIEQAKALQKTGKGSTFEKAILRDAIASGELTEAEINDRCLRILRTKEWVGLSNYTPIKTKGLVEDLNSASAKSLQAKLVEQSLTVIRNEKETLPINFREYKKVAVVEIGAAAPTAFTAAISKYLPVDVFMMEKNPEYKSAMAWYDKLSEYDLVIADMVGTSNKASKNFGVTNESARILNSVGEKTTVVLAVLANPYSLSTLRDLSNIEGVVVAYQDDELTRKACAELIVGATDASAVKVRALATGEAIYAFSSDTSIATVLSTAVSG